jgi:hypothetical protein
MWASNGVVLAVASKLKELTIHDMKFTYLNGSNFDSLEQVGLLLAGDL